ncbi:MAG: hypothetical protein JXA69_06170, partial [Phycisphaerae bacterium]|nr:hypothetical protein [Phycisphaerae bacterium]
LPPRAGKPYQTRVPAVDEDGNEIAGVFMPDAAVPLGTHVGWNQRAPKFGAAGMLGRWVGASWPFPVTPEQRQRDNDPRRSVLERYATKEEYVAKVKTAAEQLLRERFLLEEDVERVVKKAGELSLWDASRK